MAKTKKMQTAKMKEGEDNYMSSWWDSLEAVTKFNTTVQWLAAVLAILAGVFGVLILISGSRLSALQNKQAESKEAEFKSRLEAAEAKQKGRHLTAEQQDKLVALLRTFPDKGVIDVICQPNDAEAFVFAQELLGVFAENGWTRTGVIQWFGLQLRPGISLAIHSPQDAPPYTGPLQDTLNSIGLPVVGVIDPEHVPKGTVAIAVGPQP